MVELIKLINKEQLQIEEQLQQEDKTAIFYKEFFKKNPCSTIKTAAQSNKCDLAIALIARNHPELDIEEIKKAVHSNGIIFESLDTESFEIICAVIEKLEKDEFVDFVREHLVGKKKLKFKDVFKEEAQIAYVLENHLKELDLSPTDFVSFMDLYLALPEEIAEAVSIIYALEEIETERESRQYIVQKACEDMGIKLKGKERKKIVAEEIEMNWQLAAVMKPIEEAKEYGRKKESEEKTRRKMLSKNKATYERLINILYAAKPEEEIRGIETIVEKIPNEEIRLHTLRTVYTHNKAVYDAMSAEYKTLAANDASHYQILLAKHGISPETYQVGTIMNNSIEDTEEMLQQLARLKITSAKDIIKVLSQSNLETIKPIVELVDRGIITSELIVNNNNMLNPTSKEYENFMTNLEVVLEKRINPRHLNACEYVFLSTHSRFKENLEVLESYDLTSSIKTGKDYDFLAGTELTLAIDTLLELGYEKNLLENLELLNYKDKFDRLRVLKALNVPVTTTEDLLEVLTTDKFIMPDNVIENYIYNAVDYNLPSNIIISKEPKKKVSDITRLNDFSYTSRTYSFDGILISKNKVHRNLSTVDTATNVSDRLLYSVIKGSTLTDEELETIHSSLTQKKSTNKTNKKQ